MVVVVVVVVGGRVVVVVVVVVGGRVVVVVVVVVVVGAAVVVGAQAPVPIISIAEILFSRPMVRRSATLAVIREVAPTPNIASSYKMAVTFGSSFTELIVSFVNPGINFN